MTQPSAKEALLFDLTLTDDQRLTRETMQRFAEFELRKLSRQTDETHAIPHELLQKAHELGITALAVPEEHGGAGSERSPVSNVLVAEDLGKGDLGLALAILSPLGFVNALIDHGSSAQQAKYLPAYAAENFKAAAVAISEPRVTFDVYQPHTTAKREGDGYTLNGTKSMVPLVSLAEQFLVIAELEGEGPQAFIVDAGTAGLRSEEERYMGLAGLGLGNLHLENVQVGADALLGEGEKAFDYRRFVTLNRLGVCAAALGTAQAVLDHTSQYVNERYAFGEPISHRQSVAFMVANIAIELDSMRLLVWRAASRIEHGLDYQRNAHLAYVNCAERMMQIGTDGLQLLGGHGFIREHMEELWYRALRSAAILEGGFHV